MTIAIGMICSDGVLVASDSMGSAGLIARPVEKVNAFESRPLVWTRSGSEFIAQRIGRTLKKWDEPSDSSTPLEIAHHTASDLATAYREPIAPPGDPEHDLKVHAGETLVLDWGGGDPKMAHLPADLAAVDCSDRRFVAVGSGHEYASVVYATLAHYAEGSPLPLWQGCLIAYRIVSAVCQVSSWGVGIPVQMALGDASGARILSPADIEDLDTSVQRWLTSEHDAFKGNRAKGSIKDLPTMPEPQGQDQTG